LGGSTKRVFVLTFCGALAPGLARAQTVQELGPAPTDGFGGAAGRVSALALSNINPNLYYAAGADGGVWRSDNAGATWRPLTDSQITTSMGALALDPNNDQVIYAGTGEANFANHSRPGEGILKSTDGGTTWQLLGQTTFSGRCISRIVIGSGPNLVYAAVTHAGGFPALAAAKGHPGASGAVGVFKSIDFGVTWSQLSGGLPALDATDLVVDRQNPTTLYAAVGAIFGDANNGLYKSVDSGITWNRLTSGLPAPAATTGRVGVAIAGSNDQVLFTTFIHAADATGAGATLIGVYRTINAGATWTAVNSGLNPSDYGWYFTTIGIAPFDQQRVFLGGVDPRYSSNGGVSFTTGAGYHPDFHAAAWDAASRLILGCDGGVYRTLDGTTYTAMNAGLGTAQLYAGLSTHPTNPMVMYAGLQDNGSNQRNGTLTWHSVFGGDGGWTQVDPANGSRVYVEDQGTGSLAVSTNGGASFNSIGSGLSGRSTFENPYLLDPNTPGRMIYGTERVWVSTNYGTSFTPLSPDLTSGGATSAIRCLAMSTLDSTRVYAATNDGRVLASIDSGATFQLLRSGNPGWPRLTHELVVDPTDPNTVYLAVAGYGTGAHLLKNTGQSLTWTELGASLPDLPVNSIAVDRRASPPNLYAGTEAGLYLAAGEGAWRRLPGIPSTPVIDLAFEPARLRVIVSTQGRGAWSLSAPAYCSADFNGDGAIGTDADIESFFACLAGNCCATCGSADFNGDGAVGTDADIESFFRVLSGGPC
jgi:hypothetical protein